MLYRVLCRALLEQLASYRRSALGRAPGTLAGVERRGRHRVAPCLSTAPRPRRFSKTL